MIADGVADKLAGGVQIQFLHDMRAMIFNRPHAHLQDRRYLLVALPLGQKLDDLAFTRSNPVDAWSLVPRPVESIFTWHPS